MVTKGDDEDHGEILRCARPRRASSGVDPPFAKSAKDGALAKAHRLKPACGKQACATQLWLVEASTCS